MAARRPVQALSPASQNGPIDIGAIHAQNTAELRPGHAVPLTHTKKFLGGACAPTAAKPSRFVARW